MEPIKKVLMRNNKFYYWSNGDFYSDAGVIKEEDLSKDTNIVKAHSGKELFMYPASYLDKIKKIKRGPQTLLPKDLAIITFYSAIDKNSKVLDAGTGCGLLAISLSRIAKEVISYEKDESNINLARKNLELLEAENVTIKHKNIYEGIEESNLDLITLDLPEPWRVLPHAKEALKLGAYIITYLPTITQVAELVHEANRQGFLVEKTIEVLEREWHIEGKKIRPKSNMQGHTAFITIIRKK